MMFVVCESVVLCANVNKLLFEVSVSEIEREMWDGRPCVNLLLNRNAVQRCFRVMMSSQKSQIKVSITKSNRIHACVLIGPIGRETWMMCCWDRIVFDFSLLFIFVVVTHTHTHAWPQPICLFMRNIHFRWPYAVVVWRVFCSHSFNPL